ncbi:MAG TPA: 6-phosphofructokinase, partial [Candidatus Acetothermia bacterium]|nr:6-phosphofructokinase [Candidatus Acetothermia bacterium]
MKRIGVLTGGGDSPGINSALRAIVRRAHAAGVEVTGFRDGWLGPIKGNEEYVCPLSLQDVSGILYTGGTILGTSRTNPFQKVKKGQAWVRVEWNGQYVWKLVKEADWEPTKQVDAILSNLHKLKVDVLIAIGGDDTLGVAHRLGKQGVKVVGIPQTIDNDIGGTDYAIGFHSALVTVTDALDKLHTTAHAHHRVLIVEVMGRDSGWIALYGGLAGGADVILVPEGPPEGSFSVDEVEKVIRRRLDQGKRFSIVVVAEGARPRELGGKQVESGGVDAFGNPRLGGVGYWLARQLEERELPLTPRVTVLAYLQRGGIATPFDRLLATQFGVKAVELALEGVYDVLTGLHGDQVEPVPLAQALAECPKPVNPELL